MPSLLRLTQWDGEERNLTLLVSTEKAQCRTFSLRGRDWPRD
jgi:hypothetical protein